MIVKSGGKALSSASFLYFNNKRQDHRSSSRPGIEQLFNLFTNGVFQVVPAVAGRWLRFLDR